MVARLTPEGAPTALRPRLTASLPFSTEALAVFASPASAAGRQSLAAFLLDSLVPKFSSIRPAKLGFRSYRKARRGWSPLDFRPFGVRLAKPELTTKGLPALSLGDRTHRRQHCWKALNVSPRCRVADGLGVGQAVLLLNATDHVRQVSRADFAQSGTP